MNNSGDIYYRMNDAKIASLSVIAGAIVSISLLAVASVLDKYMDAKTSNMISLLIGMCINFFLQQMIFVEGEITETMGQMVRYATADIIILGSNQLAMNYLLDNEGQIQEVPARESSRRIQYCVSNDCWWYHLDYFLIPSKEILGLQKK